MPAETVRAFCEDSSAFTTNIMRVTYAPLDIVLSTVEIAANQPNMVDYLDVLKVADEPDHDDALRLLKHLPPQLVLDEYGPEVLCLVAGEATHPMMMIDERGLLLDRSNDIPDYTLHRTRRWRTRGTAPRGRDFVAQYEMSRLLLRGVLEDFDLPAALHDAADEPDAYEP